VALQLHGLVLLRRRLIGPDHLQLRQMIRPNFLRRRNEMSRYFFEDDEPEDVPQPKQPRFDKLASTSWGEGVAERYRQRGEKRLAEMLTPKPKLTAASALYPRHPTSAATGARPTPKVNAAQALYPRLKTQAEFRAAEAKSNSPPRSSRAARALHPRLP
jgi:hypothetical protein